MASPRRRGCQIVTKLFSFSRTTWAISGGIAADIMDGTGLSVDAPEVTDQNFADDRKTRGQHDACREWADARGDRAHDRKARVLGEGARRDHQGRSAAGLLSASGRVEISPDQITASRHIGRSRHSSTASRPTSGPQSKASA